MSDPRIRHRHLVVLPLFLLMAVASASPAFFSGHSTLASASQVGSVQDLGGGLQVRVEDSGKLKSGIVPAMEQGSALFRAEGISQVRLPVGSVLTIAGAFHIVINGQSITVSAITAPVFVTVQGHMALVPVGMQFQVPSALPDAEAPIVDWVAARKTMFLPEYFIRDQLQKLQAFPSAEEWLPLTPSALLGTGRSLPKGREVGESLIFSAAQEREREQWRLQVLGALRAAADQGEEMAIQKVAQTQAYNSALADPKSLSVLMTLASRSQVSTRVRASLLRFLLPRPDLWLLAAVHPVLQTGAWAAGQAALTPEEEMILAFGMPATDRSQEGYSPVVLTWWAQSVAHLIAVQKQPVPFVTELLTNHLPLVQEYVRLRYPERAQILTQALQSFAKPVHAELPGTLLESLTQAERLSADSFSVFALPESASSSSVPNIAESSSVIPLSQVIVPDERVSRVEASLEQAGALFGVQTKITALPDGVSVHVSGVLFSSPAADRSYAFDVDIPKDQVSSIVRDGKLLPYPMALPAFLEWVRK